LRGWRLVCAWMVDEKAPQAIGWAVTQTVISSFDLSSEGGPSLK